MSDPKTKIIEMATQLKVAIEMIYQVSVWVVGPIYTTLVKAQDELIAARRQMLTTYDEVDTPK